jgi:integrase
MIRRSKSGLPKHCGYNTDRHGKRRVRFRRNGFSVYLTGTPWSEDFMRQYAAALDGVTAQAQSIGAGRTVAGSVNALVVGYLESSLFKSGAAETRRTRRNILENFREQHGDKPVFRLGGNGEPVMLLTRQIMQRIVNAKAATPSAQRNFLFTLRAMFQWAYKEGRIPDDPTLGVTREKIKTDGYRTWSEAEIARFEAHHPVGSKGRLAFALLLYTGQRRGDVVRIAPQDIHNGLLTIEQSKTEAHLEIPLHPKLRAIIDATPTGRRADVAGDTLRQALHGARVRQLVSRAVRRRWLLRSVGARPAQGGSATARRDRMQRQPDRQHHRTCIDQRGATLHQGRRPQASRARGDEQAGRGRMVNETLSNPEAGWTKQEKLT